MKNCLLNIIKFKIFLLFFILQSCFNGSIDKVNGLNMEAFDQLQILRDGTKIDTSVIDSFSITLDTIISREDEECK